MQTPRAAAARRDVTQVDRNAILRVVDTLSAEELDRLPYGMIQLDLKGCVVKYNAIESKLASLPQRQQLGKHFFTEVAPCTQVQEFHGRFIQGVRNKALDVSFGFRFAFKQHPRDVSIRIFYSPLTNSVWVMVADRDGQPIV